MWIKLILLDIYLVYEDLIINLNLSFLLRYMLLIITGMLLLPNEAKYYSNVVTRLWFISTDPDKWLKVLIKVYRLNGYNP